MYPKIVEHEFSSFLMIFQSLATPLTPTYFILRQLKCFSILKNHEIYMPTQAGFDVTIESCSTIRSKFTNDFCLN